MQACYAAPYGGMQEIVWMAAPDQSQTMPTAGPGFPHPGFPLEVIHNTAHGLSPYQSLVPVSSLLPMMPDGQMLIQSGQTINSMAGYAPQRQLLTVPTSACLPRLNPAAGAAPTLIPDRTGLLCTIPQQQQQQQQRRGYQLASNQQKMISFQQHQQHHHQQQQQQQHHQQQRQILRAKRRIGGLTDLLIPRKSAVTSGQSLLGRPDQRSFDTCVMSVASKRVNESNDDLLPVGQAKRVTYEERSIDVITSRGGDETSAVTARDENPSVLAHMTMVSSNVVGQQQQQHHRTLGLSMTMKAMRAVEHYFSDESLAKNAYLLKHIQQHKEGFISVRRVAGLKRVKALTRDIAFVTESIRHSVKLELSPDSLMMRRKDNLLPKNIETQPAARKIIAINLPQATPTLESVTSLFAPYGELTQVCVLKPGVELPQRLNSFKSWVPDLGIKYCALVEFESQESAQKACREINMQNREVNKFRVALLKNGARLRRTLYRVYKDESEASPTPAENYSSSSTSSMNE